MKTIRLVKTQADVTSLRRQLSVHQKYKCPICGGTVATTGRLDHDHDTGHVRGVLCNTCNRNEGKVKAAVKFMTKLLELGRKDYLQWLINLVKYLEYHRENPSGLIHPTFDYEKGKQKPKKRTRKRKKKT